MAKARTLTLGHRSLSSSFIKVSVVINCLQLSPSKFHRDCSGHSCDIMVTRSVWMNGQTLLLCDLRMFLTDVLVFYVDFGNLETLKLNQLRPLPPGVLCYPCQAFACTLLQVYLS